MSQSNDNSGEALEIVDARGLLCPLPVIRTQDKIKTMTAGQELEVLATDPGALHDIPAWCRVHKHELVSMEEASAQNEQVIRIRVRVI